MEDNKRRLRELKGSDYKIVDEQPDIKGWTLYDSQHRKLGEVDDLLFDAEARKVRYIIADLDGNDLDLDEKEVLIPIGIAELHESEDEVILPGVTASQLNALPEYNDRELTAADENIIFAAFSDSETVTSSDRYNHAHFDDQRIYRNRNRATTMDESSIPVFREDIEIRESRTEGDRDRDSDDGLRR
jgi:hypothetical protein